MDNKISIEEAVKAAQVSYSNAVKRMELVAEEAKKEVDRRCNILLRKYIEVGIQITILNVILWYIIYSFNKCS